MNQKSKNRECPYCKEEIKNEAIKCKHCHSKLEAESPPHKGVCPYCKEDIHSEAIKCKHCKSDLVANQMDCKCGCGGHSKAVFPSVGYFDNISGPPIFIASKRCAPGKSYECGSLPGGGTMICCDEWIDDTIIKNPPTHFYRR